MAETRTCAACGKELTRREGERLAKFRERRTCNRRCAAIMRGAWKRNSRPEMICEGCGKPFTVVAHLVKAGRRFCSWECRTDIRTVTCDRCGKSFKRQGAEIDRAKRRGQEGIYCSQACYRAEDRTYTYSCEQCGKPVTTYLSAKREHESRGSRLRYCSQACRSAHQRPNRTCGTCGAMFRPCNKRQQYCSVACRAESRKDREVIPCEVCGKPSTYTRQRVETQEHFFCSHECMGKAVHTWSITTGYRHGYREDIGLYVRSSWEANVARFFKFMHLDYQYEPEQFEILSGVYIPDFRVDGTYIEVKGWMRDDARQKIEEFRSTYPSKSLVLIDQEMYRHIEREFRTRIPEWE